MSTKKIKCLGEFTFLEKEFSFVQIHLVVFCFFYTGELPVVFEALKMSTCVSRVLSGLGLGQWSFGHLQTHSCGVYILTTCCSKPACVQVTHNSTRKVTVKKKRILKLRYWSKMVNCNKTDANISFKKCFIHLSSILIKKIKCFFFRTFLKMHIFCCNTELSNAVVTLTHGDMGKTFSDALHLASEAAYCLIQVISGSL